MSFTENATFNFALGIQSSGEGSFVEERGYYSVLFALQEVFEYFLKLFWHFPAQQERREV